MSGHEGGQIRLDLVGKRAETWNRVFDGLAGIVEKCVQNATENILDEDDREQASTAARDIASMAGDWARARIEKPTLENELILADIAKRFEEVKLMQVQRETAQIERDQKQLDHWEAKMKFALRWMAFLQTHVVRGEDGSVTLLLTNQNLLELQQGMAELRKEATAG